MLNDRKKTIIDVLIVSTIIFSVLPFVVTFSSVLTTFFDHMGWYVWLQKQIVPHESRYVAFLVNLIGVNSRVILGQTNYSIVLEKAGGVLLPVALEWNCLGWQSLLLLFLTFVTGLRGPHTFLSKIQSILIGILGTFLINLFRMAFIVSMAYYWNEFAAVIVHDYFASFVALVWMVFFWWFVHEYVLEEKVANVNE